jgi:hypothetical protein
MHLGTIRVSIIRRSISALDPLMRACLFWLVVLAAGCQTSRPLPPADLSAPGWQIKHGQAVWRPLKNEPEIAGDLMLATRPGASFVQFTKTPFPLVTAQTAGGEWEIQLGPEGKTYSGKGAGPARLIWLRLDDVLFRGSSLPRGWSADISDEQWRFEHQSTGETLEGYFDP